MKQKKKWSHSFDKESRGVWWAWSLTKYRKIYLINEHDDDADADDDNDEDEDDDNDAGEDDEEREG